MYNPNMDENDDAPDVTLIIPAAGNSSRMEMNKRKPWLEIGGKPIVYRTLEAFKDMPEVSEVILVVNEGDLGYCREKIWNELSARGVTMVIAGGANRAESVWNAVQVAAPSSEVIAIHDAVRPFIVTDTCKALFKMALKYGAAVPATHTHDTIKRVEGDKITETVRRLGLMAVQTPQCFRRDLLVDAYEFAFKTGGLNENITDDASLVENYGQEVSVILGNATNIKITTQDDLVLASALLRGGLV